MLEIAETNSIPALESGQRQDSVGGSGVVDALENRMKMLDCYLDAIPRNVENKRRLVECGYSISLWEKVSGPLNCGYMLNTELTQVLQLCTLNLCSLYFLSSALWRVLATGFNMNFMHKSQGCMK